MKNQLEINFFIRDKYINKKKTNISTIRRSNPILKEMVRKKVKKLS